MRPAIALILIGILLVMTGGIVWAGGAALTGGLVLGAGALLSGVMIASLLLRRQATPAIVDTDRIEEVSDQRQRELLRGTSMHLRDMKYRYSIRFDHGGRSPFTTEVNTITLGFVPVIILDNRSDKQGYGYVAFPYDGRRWRGPGLPCGGGPEDAIAHAARCVAPLEREDDDGEDEDDDDGDGDIPQPA